MVETRSLDEATYLRYRREILEYLGFRPFGTAAQQELTNHLQAMVRCQARPKFMLLRALNFLEQRKVEIPTLRTLSDIILGEIRQHRGKLNQCLDRALSLNARSLVEDLLDKSDGDDETSQKFQRYRLTLLKRVSQSTKVKKIRAAVEDLLTVRELFEQVESVFASLDLSHEGVRYYANSVLKSQIFQVARRQEDDRHLHLVCFIAHQYLRMQDTLVDIFLLSVQTSVNACRRQHKEAYYEGRAARRRSLREFAVSVDTHALSPLSKIESIAFDVGLDDTQKVEQIQSVLSSRAQDRRGVVTLQYQ